MHENAKTAQEYQKEFKNVKANPFFETGSINPFLDSAAYLIGADKLGNINMAYVGDKMGLPEWVYKNFETTDGEDAEWVQRGIDLVKSGR